MLRYIYKILEVSRNAALQIIFIFVTTLLWSTVVTAKTELEGQVETPTGHYNLTVTDLDVKTLGGTVSIQRTWYNHQWSINRSWNRLTLIAPLGWNSPNLPVAAVDRFIRNGKVYSRVNSNSNEFVPHTRDGVNPTSRIIILNSGWLRWQDRTGSWIEYNEKGLIARYGDRNNVQVSFGYDSFERISGVFDHFGTQLLWYEYHSDYTDMPSAIHDASTPQRRVQYDYSPVHRLIQKVTDVNNKDWTYNYATLERIVIIGNVVTSEDVYKLSGITDPDGRSVTINYHINNLRTKSITRADGTGTFYSYGYNDSEKSYAVHITSSNGEIKDLTYDKDGEVIRRDINGKTVYTMKKTGRKRIIEDELGNITIRENDQWDNLVKVTNSDRSTRSYVLDPEFSQVLQKTNERGVVTKNDYDTNGNLIRKIEAFGLPEERITEYDYDAYGNLWKQRVLADASTELAETVYTYDNFGNIDTITDPEGNVTDYLEYDAMGNPLKWHDGRGKLWQRSYDGKGQLLSETDPLDHITTYQYDGAGNRTHVTNAELKTTETVFDTNNRPQAIIDALNNPQSMTYNALGEMASVVDRENKKVAFGYDEQGRVSKVIDGVNNTIQYHYGAIDSGASYQQLSSIDFPTYSEYYQYDQQGRKKQVTQRTGDNGDFVTSYGYDLVGNLTSITDPKLRTINLEYDALNRIKVITNPLNDTVLVNYDDRDNVLGVTNENGIVIRRYSYDRNNRKKTETWPGGSLWAYDYDEEGNLIQQQDAKGQVTRFQYDDAGRKEQIDYFPDATATTAEKTVAFGYDNLGNITSYNDGSISGNISYDDLLRKTGETVNYGPFTKSYQYGYYKNGKRQSYAAPDASLTEYSYDPANRLSKVKLPANQGSIVYTDYRWKQPGRIIYPGGAQRLLGYDDLLRITDIDVSDPAGNPLMDYHYTYDRVGNIDQKTTEHGIYKFDYDQLDRLTSAINPTLDDEAYDYDPAGNRIKSSDVTGNWIYNDSNQLRTYGSSSLSYDANGSTVLKEDILGRTAYEYNLENRLDRVVNDSSNAEISRYYYDPFGRRMWKDVNGVRSYFMYAEEGLIGEYDAAGNEIRSYLYEPKTRWGTAPIYLKQGSNSGFYQLDHLGTPQKVVSAMGNVLWASESRAFGEVTKRVSLVNNPLRFPGQYYDEETKLDYNFLRYYTPSIGRYISSDPIDIIGGMNTFNYVLGNPVNLIDPKGEFALNVAGAVLGGISGTYGAYVSSGADPLSMFFGAVSGAIIGGTNPFSVFGTVGGAFLNNATASLMGQGFGRLISPKKCGFNLLAAGFAGIGGVVALPVRWFAAAARGVYFGEAAYGMVGGLFEAAGFQRR